MILCQEFYILQKDRGSDSLERSLLPRLLFLLYKSIGTNLRQPAACLHKMSSTCLGSPAVLPDYFVVGWGFVVGLYKVMEYCILCYIILYGDIISLEICMWFEAI